MSSWEVRLWLAAVVGFFAWFTVAAMQGRTLLTVLFGGLLVLSVVKMDLALIRRRP